MSNIQPLLVSRKGTTSDLSLMLSSDSTQIFVFLGTALLERINASPAELQYKLMVGRMVNANHRMADLRRCFGHDPRTMSQWGAALQSEDSEFILRALSGRGGASKKMTPEIMNYVQRRYQKLRCLLVRNYSEKIKDEVEEYFGVGVSPETLRRLFREADRKSGASKEADKSSGWVSNPDSGTKSELKHNQSTNNQERWDILPRIITEPSKTVRGIHHAGMILFILMLEIFRRDRPVAAEVQSQWVGQILQGAVNIEQSRMITPADLSRFVEMTTLGIEPQRRQLREMAESDAALDIYKANARFLPDGPDRGDVFYYDPHAKEYTGGLDALKGWCGSRHGVAKAIYLDAIHTESGLPCFVHHYSPYYDLRERFFITFKVFNRLFSSKNRRKRTFVLDRGIFGLDVFRRFLDAEDSLLTWEKGYAGDGWREDAETVEFVKFRHRNYAADLRRYSFQCQESPWEKDSSVRRIVVRAVNPEGRRIEVSVLCTNPDMDIERAVWIIFTRWLQENNFKYLDKHFGLNQLTSYASTTYARTAEQYEDRQTENPQHKKQVKDLRKLESEIGRDLLKYRKNEKKLITFESDIEVLNAKIDMLENQLGGGEKRKELVEQRTRRRQQRTNAVKRKEKLTAAIADAEEEAQKMQTELAETLKYTSKLENLIEQNRQSLDLRAKAVFDALRIVSANMFGVLARRFRPIFDNHRNDHVILRHLTRADGFVRNIDGTVHIQLWLKGRFQKQQIIDMKRFLAQCTDEINAELPARAEKIRISLVDSTPSW